MKYYVKKKKLLRYEICLELKSIRMKMQMTVSDVAKKLNIPVYVLSKAENGEKILSYDFIKKYLEVFNINIENYKKFKNFKKNLLI